MIENILSNALVSGLIGAVVGGVCITLFALVRKSNAKKAQEARSEEHVVIRSPKAHLWVGVAAVVVFSGFLVLALLSPGVSWQVVGVIFFLLAMLYGVGMVVAVLLWKVDVYRSRDYFNYTTWLGKTYTVRYCDIESYRQTMSTLIIKAGRNYRVDNMNPGKEVLAEMLIEKGVSGTAQSKSTSIIGKR